MSSHLRLGLPKGLFPVFPLFREPMSFSKFKIILKNYTYFNYLFFHRRPTHKLCFLSCTPFVVNATFSTGLVVSSVSWLGQLAEFKSLIISIVGFRNFICCLVCAVDLGVQITDEGRSLYIGSFCPAMTSLSSLLQIPVQ